MVWCLLGLVARTGQAQEWDTPGVLRLVSRAMAHRAGVDSAASRPWFGRAHGGVTFLRELGPRREARPRISKLDELHVEVYWQSPGKSKQRIVAWRDTVALPTGIVYHRDHLGLIFDEFGEAIRLGEGQEVRDVPHPLGARALRHYEYAGGDTVRVITATDTLDLIAVHVRPRNVDAPGIVGTLFLERRRAALVRFRFTFTPASYRDRTVETITVLLENARVEDRWLPWRQELEVRRSAPGIALPLRTAIRTEWQMERVELDAPEPPGFGEGPAIGGLRRPDPTAVWDRSLEETLGTLDPLDRREMQAVHREAGRLVSLELKGTVRRARPAFGGVSDLIRFTRVEGVAPGGGGELRLGPGITARGAIRVGLSGGGLQARLAADLGDGPLRVTVWGAREVRDVEDHAVVSGLAQSLVAQGGLDLADWLLERSVGVLVNWSPSPVLGGRVGLSVERTTSLATVVGPLVGRFRPNPILGSGTVGVLRTEWVGAGSGAVTWRVEGEAGAGSHDYLRFHGELGVRQGPLSMVGRVGWGSRDLPVARSLALGGWGTLEGEGFRRFGGRRMGLLEIGYDFHAPGPSLPLVRGPYAPAIRISPIGALGWAGGALPGVPWGSSKGVRPMVGLSLGLAGDLLDVRVGWAVRARRLGVSVDLDRALWPVL